MKKLLTLAAVTSIFPFNSHAVLLGDELDLGSMCGSKAESVVCAVGITTSSLPTFLILDAQMIDSPNMISGLLITELDLENDDEKSATAAVASNIGATIEEVQEAVAIIISGQSEFGYELSDAHISAVINTL